MKVKYKYEDNYDHRSQNPTVGQKRLIGEAECLLYKIDDKKCLFHVPGNFIDYSVTVDEARTYTLL